MGAVGGAVGGVSFRLTVNGDVLGIDDLREQVLRWFRDSERGGGFHGIERA